MGRSATRTAGPLLRLGMDLIEGFARPRSGAYGMPTFTSISFMLACLCVSLSAFPLQGSRVQLRPPELSLQASRTSPKRGRDMVDAWALCPPDMEQMECFYTYLRLYARLRKASRETDRVSMRNIGKRGGQTGYLCDENMDKFTCFSHILYYNIQHARV